MAFFDKNKDRKITLQEFVAGIPKVNYRIILIQSRDAAQLQEQIKSEIKRNDAATTDSVSSLHRLRRKHVVDAKGPRQKVFT